MKINFPQLNTLHPVTLPKKILVSDYESQKILEYFFRLIKKICNDVNFFFLVKYSKHMIICQFNWTNCYFFSLKRVQSG